MSGPALKIVQPGLHTTLQDLGRAGFREFGVPVSGALDRDAMRLANALVGNQAGLAVLECLHLGPSLEVEAESVRVAVCGPCRLIRTQGGERSPFIEGRSYTLMQGDRLDIVLAPGGRVACLAVSGGFDVPGVLGSLSSYRRAGLGLFAGRPWQAGDVLPLKLARAPGGAEKALSAPFATHDGPLRVVLGPQAANFTKQAVERLLSCEFIVGRQSDRMGLRLEGPLLPHAADADIPSDGLVAGCLQVPGDGKPILLLADHQTTGGYAKIATVISADLSRAGRLAPGQGLRFLAVTVDEAEEARRCREKELQSLIEGLRAARPEGGIDLDALYGANLVSGLVDARSVEDDPES
jgi:biotin-dependent carboxylase-like uncharacterized protein